MNKLKLNTKKIVAAICWSMVAILVSGILIAGINKNETSTCKAVDVTVRSDDDNFFIDKKEVLKWVNDWNGGSVTGKALKAINIRKIETNLLVKTWVSSAQVYMDDDNRLHIIIRERTPVVRVFNIGGASFYLDSAAHILPVTMAVAARVPVFTGFTGSPAALSRTDSNTVFQIIKIGQVIHKDDFLMAMIEQIDINMLRKFELIPKIGNQVIYFGDTTSLNNKFRKLKSFYKNILASSGWAKYSSINLEYENQVVAKIRDREDIVADSLRTLQLMEILASRAEAASTDSLNAVKTTRDLPVDSTILSNSVERDEGTEQPDSVSTIPVSKPVNNVTIPATAPVKAITIVPAAIPKTKKIIVKPTAPKAGAQPVKKPVTQPAKKPVTKPKIIMPKATGV